MEKRVLKYKIWCFKFLSILTLVISSSAFAVDTDGDGYDDAVDLFPTDPLEWIDTDLDGTGNNSDPDIDGDGLLNGDSSPFGNDNNDDGDLAINLYDPLPKDPSEWLDTDNDGLGNNTDTDDDNDGVPDLLDVFPLNLQESLDSDLDGVGNNADDDGDGVLDVYDQFPLDPLETVDTDLDGIGNNADIDDDGDGVNDGSDAFPLDFNVNADLDADGIGNAQDPDIDGDGIVNTLDVFRYDYSEWYDTDGDMIGNNKDTDDDNDGVLDTLDDMPLDPLEILDTDNDGIGNNADDDDDGDGVQDSIDIFPLDSAEHLDLDTDGIGDNSDPDIDGDGELNTNDAFPFLASEQKDTDGDGLGDKSDNDIDGDGVTNGPFTSGNYNDPSDTVFTGNDFFPFTASEYIDTDGNGVGNTADLDDDGDGVLDTDDVFPLDNTEQKDLDGDGIGDKGDPDIDGDGVTNGNFSSGNYSDLSDPVYSGNDAFPFIMLATTDTDGDRLPNEGGDTPDDDDDGDVDIGGLPDATDAFPLDPTEWLDSDGDGLGNNADSDDDNDGISDNEDDFPLDASEYLNTDASHPTNSDSIGNNADTDDDGDGVLDCTGNGLLCDAYPLNANEQYDNDGDGVGDNADSDDDNDGFTDAIDALPLNPLEWFDTDRDGTGNNADTDDDDDGRSDSIDLFPLDKTEWLDADNDGLGDNSDSDDDNDGVRDIEDAFPNNPVESTDTDGDGLGNVFDSNDDGDDFLDFEDQLPLDATEHIDTDGDSIGNNADLDDDGDGMSDEFELLHNFDPLNDEDGLYDTDSDGVTNAAEALAGNNPLLDDYAPIITPPQAVHIYADHTFTKLELSKLIQMTKVSVTDGKDGINCCNLTALGFETGAKNITSGLYPIKWRAVDNAGNSATTNQVLNVHPLVNFSSAQIVAEGGIARVEVVLSGEAPAYPVTLPLTITGTVDNADYNIADNKIVIAQGTAGFIDINVNNDFQVEGDEQLILSFEQGVNAGVHAEHIITVTEGNVAPTINLAIWQKGIQVPSVASNDGAVTVVLSIKDSNVQDTHQIDWQIPDYLNAVLSTDKLQFVFPVESLSLPKENKGLIHLSVTVTDSGNSTNSGTEELSQTKQISLVLLATQQTLRGLDSDRDGLSDLVEGFSDDDSDGLPAYMDNSTIPYLQPLHINAALVKLAETEPGLHLKLGKFALLQTSDGIALSQQEILATGLIEEDSLKNSLGYFDFEIHNITPFGRSVAIVLPLSTAIVEYSVYRKVNSENQWADFAEDSNNVLSTSAAVNGVCPPPHSELYRAGLNVGDTCLKLYIEDGGANDADGIANGVIDDPGGIAVDVPPEKSSSGSLSFFALFALFLVVLSRLMRSEYLAKE